MSEMITKRCVGTNVSVKSDANRPMLDVDYDSLETSLNRAKERYDRCRADYFNTLLDEPELPGKTKRWQRAAHDYLRWIEAIFNVKQDDNEARQNLIDLMDRITKEGGVRHHNICRHVDLMTEKIAAVDMAPEKREEELEKLEKAEIESGAFYRSALLTQNHFIDLLQKGECYVSLNQQQEIAAAARVAELRERYFPKDRVYLPGRIIPPHRVPMTERVPDCPLAYEKAENQPIDAYEWNDELQEIVIKPGYVSEDGTIDDQSVVIDPVNNKVTIKFRGGTPVVWDWWKPKDTYDLPERGSWVEEYLIRSYAQMVEDMEPGILKHQAYEDDIPEYDKIPSNSQ